MTISERLFQIMEERKMTQAELSRQTGISVQTISDWRHKKTNPGADKIMIICEVLQIDPKTLLTGDGRDEREVRYSMEECLPSQVEEELIYGYREFSEEKKRRLLAYMNMLANTKE